MCWVLVRLNALPCVYWHFMSICEEGNQCAWESLWELFLFFAHFQLMFWAFSWLICESLLLWLYFHHSILNNRRKASGLNYKSLFLLYGPADLLQKLCFRLTRSWSGPHLSCWDQCCFWACSCLREMAEAQAAKPNNANTWKPLCFFSISAFHGPKQVRWQSLGWGCLFHLFYLEASQVTWQGG